MAGMAVWLATVIHALGIEIYVCSSLTSLTAHRLTFPLPDPCHRICQSQPIWLRIGAGRLQDQ